MVPKQSLNEGARKRAKKQARGTPRSLGLERAQRQRLGGTRIETVEREIFVAIAEIGLQRAQEIINDVAVNKW